MSAPGAGFSDRHTASITFTPSTGEAPSCSAIGGAMEALLLFALFDSASARRETTTIPELSSSAMAAPGFARHDHVGFRSNGRKPVSIDEART
jgi:hypothetical protein